MTTPTTHPLRQPEAFHRGRRAMLLARYMADAGWTPEDASPIAYDRHAGGEVVRDSFSRQAGLDGPTASATTWATAVGILAGLVELAELAERAEIFAPELDPPTRPPCVSCGGNLGEDNVDDVCGPCAEKEAGGCRVVLEYLDEADHLPDDGTTGGDEVVYADEADHPAWTEEPYDPSGDGADHRAQLEQDRRMADRAVASGQVAPWEV